MTIAERMAALVNRLPNLAGAHPELKDIWRVVDDEMASILPHIETESDQRALDDHYRELMQKADLMGLLQPE
ncbi:hypothetical protein [Thermomonas aquatica]|uniref:Uncharacterized protein n=1 Tax=Thermomonas aquatica TaxID=2202149 RepID=A0A5B7ZMY3_9GAMM|nr:hypothetical protein [Thermomonas aquatica]QDA56009.1 hypothetical protein FHQ07_01080 [Thermomonas aquatica]